VELRPGDRARILEGPMRDLEGIFLARSGKQRVVILLDILGRQTRVQFPEEMVVDCKT
jgi:transcriptional antiterminator RfaH